MASTEVHDDDIMNMSMDEAIPDAQPEKRDARPKKNKRGGSIEVKRMGITVDMVATVADAAWAKGAGYEVLSHSGHTKQVVAGSAYAPIPGNKLRGLNKARSR